MILLNNKKVNSKQQSFRFRSKFNLNKISIVKKEIKDYEKESNYGYIECPCCGSEKLISYGRYERNIIVYNICMKIRIKRVKCKGCGKTHALIPYYQHEKTFIYRVCIEKVLKKRMVCEIARKVKILRQVLYQWNKAFKIHLRYLLTTTKTGIKEALKYLINESLSEKIYERVNKMYFLKRIPT